MYRAPKRIWWVLLPLMYCALLTAGCSNVSRQDATNDVLVDEPDTVIVPQSQDVFAPFIVPVQPHTTVTWHNEDSVAHVVVTTPERSAFLNTQSFSLTIAPHQTASFTFAQPGLYHYYDNRFSTWSDSYQRVAPNKGVPKYPETMEGVIWVQGNIPNLPSAARNYVVHLRDQIALNFVAVRTGGTVTWHNYDTDAHFFQPVLGWDAPINPADIGINNLEGSDEMPPDGGSRSITFDKPGLYYYYCFTHAAIDPVLLRVYAKNMASEYPIPMEGFVLVTG